MIWRLIVLCWVYSFLFVSALASPTLDRCNVLANINITSADIAVPQFVVSAEDCCRRCSDTPSCVAAVFVGYYCHMKNSSEHRSACNSSSCVALTILSSTVVPSTAPQTTASPSHPTTRLPSTLLPSTTAPTPAPSVTLVRETICLYSSHCNILNDGSCVTKVYVNATCFKKHRRTCREFHISVEEYAEENGCAGKAVSEMKEQLDACVSYDGYNFAGHYCDTWTVPEEPLRIRRAACRYGCGSPGDQCNRYNLTSGACVSGASAFRGNSIFALAFPAYIVYEEYQTYDCSGIPTDRWAEPRDNCWTGENYVYYINNVTLA